MPESSSNKNISILPKQILWELGAGAAPSAGGRGKPEQGTPTDLLAHYRLTTAQTAPAPSQTYTAVLLNTDDVQTVSAAVTSQTPFTYTAPISDFLRVETWVELAHNASLGRWILALRITRNGYTSDVVFTLHRAKESPTAWQMTNNERIWIQANDVLQIEVRAFNTGAAAQVLTINKAAVKIWSD